MFKSKQWLIGMSYLRSCELVSQVCLPGEIIQWLRKKMVRKEILRELSVSDTRQFERTISKRHQIALLQDSKFFSKLTLFIQWPR